LIEVCDQISLIHAGVCGLSIDKPQAVLADGDHRIRAPTEENPRQTKGSEWLVLARLRPPDGYGQCLLIGVEADALWTCGDF